MFASLTEIEQQARMLSVEERARLAELLLGSLRDVHLAEIEAVWDREIDERVSAFDRGERKTYSAEDVFAEAGRLAR